MGKLFSSLLCIVITLTSSSFAATLALVPADNICMVNDVYIEENKVNAVKLGDKTYYASNEVCWWGWSCRRQFQGQKESTRFSKDPVNGNIIDKADAVYAIDLDGTVTYFENIENYKKLATQVLSGNLPREDEEKADYLYPTDEVVNHKSSPKLVYCGNKGNECQQPSELKVAPRVILSVSIPVSKVQEKPQEENAIKEEGKIESKENSKEPENLQPFMKEQIKPTEEIKEAEKPQNDSIKTIVYFDLRDSKLDKEAKAILNSLPKDKKYILVGYTCPLGTAESNKKLALARVKAVERYLEGRKKRVIAINGKGKCCYIKDDNQKVSYAKSRRVEITAKPL